MPNDVIVDSGPLIALFDAGDQHHDRALDWFRRNRFVGYTTVAVLTEVSQILRFDRKAQLAFFRWVRSGALQLVNLNGDDLDRSIDVMEQFADLPADFADATLVAVADRLGTRKVLTIDADFQIYRNRRKQTFLLLLFEARK